MCYSRSNDRVSSVCERGHRMWFCAGLGGIHPECLSLPDCGPGDFGFVPTEQISIEALRIAGKQDVEDHVLRVLVNLRDSCGDSLPIAVLVTDLEMTRRRFAARRSSIGDGQCADVAIVIHGVHTWPVCNTDVSEQG